MLLYGSGLRINEALRLRVKDVDFDMQQLIVRSGKGAKDRITLLPDRLIEPLKQQIDSALYLHQADLFRRHHLLDRTVQKLLGHSDLRTTEIYTHVVRKGGFGVRSPVDEGF